MRVASLRSKCICVASVFCHSARLHRLRAQLFQSASLACASRVCAASASVLHPCFAIPQDSTGYVLSFPRVLAWHARREFAQQVHLSCVRVLPLRDAASASVLRPCFATPRDSSGYVLSFPRVLAWHARHKFAQQVHLSCTRVLPLRETPPATCSAFPEC